MLNLSTQRLIYVVMALLLAGCASVNPQDGAPSSNIDASSIPNAVPKVEPKSRYGNPPDYVVNSHRYYVLATAKGYNRTGIASWYGTKFHGRLTSTREIYNMFGMTAASTVLPLPTYVKVTDLKNGHQVIVKVNDRGPFDQDRIIDLSYAAASKLGFANKGTALVRVTALDPIEWQHQHTKQPTEAQLKTLPVTHAPRLYLQVAAFAEQSNANHLRNRLQTLTTEPITTSKTTAPQRPLYRVQIGPIKNVAENDKLQQLLLKNGLGRGIPVVQ